MWWADEKMNSRALARGSLDGSRRYCWYAVVNPTRCSTEKTRPRIDNCTFGRSRPDTISARRTQKLLIVFLRTRQIDAHVTVRARSPCSTAANSHLGIHRNANMLTSLLTDHLCYFNNSCFQIRISVSYNELLSIVTGCYDYTCFDRQL